MCKAKEYTEQLLSIFDDINNNIKECCNILKETEGIEQDLLHILENKNFNAYEGYMLAKKIKNTRIKRRNAKIELKTLLNLRNNFCKKNVDDLKNIQTSIINQNKVLTRQKEEKIYNPRVLESTDVKIVLAS